MNDFYFETYEELLAAPGLTTPGTTAFVANESKVYVRQEQGWKPLKSETNLNVSTYELNKQIIGQLKPLTRKQVERRLGLIEDFRRATNNTYYLMYGKEINYFTLFVKDILSKAAISLEITDCLYNIGTIYDILLTEAQDAIEIWVKPTNAEEVTCLYFFPYDAGIVPFNGG